MPRKRVAQDVLDGLPELGPNQQIVRLRQPKGNHLYEVELPDGSTTLCRMPPKFRNLVWIKRGDFVITETHASSTKVTGDITCILYPPQIKHLKAGNVWAREARATSREETLWYGQHVGCCRPPEFSTVGSAADEPDQGNDHPSTGRSSRHPDRTSSSDDSDDELFTNPNHRVVHESDSDSDDGDFDEDAEEDEGDGTGEEP